jgi:hypothetical protein
MAVEAVISKPGSTGELTVQIVFHFWNRGFEQAMIQRKFHFQDPASSMLDSLLQGDNKIQPTSQRGDSGGRGRR